ncbi:MAG: glutamine amidotransferase [Hyphomicrobiales bacterium]|nr:glutamine amidotransferase [Hyphomicrobiales bacterium]
MNAPFVCLGTAKAIRVDLDAPRKVLLVFHREESQYGAVGQWLLNNGFELDIRLPRFGDALPETMEEHAGAIIFGGPMSANDPDDFIRSEIDWISVPLRENKPYFGICLGGQMLAKQLGASVAPHPDDLIEVGYYQIRPAAEDDAITMPRTVYQWHTEGFELASGAKLLAVGENFRNQAFRYGGAAYGVQFHPEMTLAMIHRWTTRAAHRFGAPGARPRHEHIMAHTSHGPGLRRWLDGFMKSWLASAAVS